jgi:hypothetical protein
MIHTNAMGEVCGKMSSDLNSPHPKKISSLGSFALPGFVFIPLSHTFKRGEDFQLGKSTDTTALTVVKFASSQVDIFVLKVAGAASKFAVASDVFLKFVHEILYSKGNCNNIIVDKLNSIVKL